MMSPGDYVVSYNGANVNIDGIGIIAVSYTHLDVYKRQTGTTTEKMTCRTII